MAYLNKQQYDYRRESAARRNLSNEEIAVQNGMAEEQAELISELCAMRHAFHSNLDYYVEGAEYSDTSKWERFEKDIVDAGLPQLNVYDQLCEIDDINGLMYDYGEDVPNDTRSAEFRAWYDDNYNRIYYDLEGVNTYIEHYLAEIDKKYGTSWCPSGALRIF